MSECTTQARRRQPSHQRLPQTCDQHARRTATMAHGLQLHPTKTCIISNPRSKTRHNNTVAVETMNIEILPPKANIKYLGQLITFKSAVHVEFDHRIECAWATLMSHMQEMTSPRHPVRDQLQLFDPTVTPSILYPSRTCTMTAEMKTKLQTAQRRMMRMVMRTKCKCRWRARRRTGRRVVAVRRATHKADDLLVANGIASWFRRQSSIRWKHTKDCYVPTMTQETHSSPIGTQR